MSGSRDWWYGQRVMLHQPDLTFQAKVWYTLAATVCVAAIVAIFVLASTYILIVLAGVILAILATAFMQRIRRTTGFSHRAAFALAWSVMLGVPLLTLAVSFPSLTAQFGELGGALGNLSASTLPGWVPGGDVVAARLAALDPAALVADVSVGQVGGAVLTVTNVIVGTLFLIFIGLFGSLDPSRYTRSALVFVPARYHDAVMHEWRTATRTLSWWFVGQLASMVVTAVLTYIGLVLIGMPLAFLLAVLAGLLTFIPNIGSIAAAGVAVVVAVPEGSTMVLLVIAVFLVAQSLESYLITPFVQQWAVHIPPAVLLVLQVILGILFGIIGLLLAAPLAALVIAFARERVAARSA